MLKKIKTFFSLLYLPFGLFLTVLYSMIILLKNIFILKKCDVLVYMSEGGFAHTIIGPDVQRRIFPGKKLVFISFSEFGRHNKLVSYLFDRIKIIFLPLNLGIRLFGITMHFPKSSMYKEKGYKIFLNFLNLINNRKKCFSLIELYNTIPSIELLKKSKKPKWLSFAHEWPINYFNLCKEKSVSNIHLPSKKLDNIQKKLQRYLGKYNTSIDELKTCSYYLRQKGNQDDNASFTRSGSSVDYYTESFQLLIDSGYVLFIRGDIELPGSIVEKYAPFLISYKQIGVSKYLFELYAATEADIAINEAGGGQWFSVINQTPSLSINTFPFGHGLPVSEILYKILKDKDGNLVPYHDIFKYYTNNYDLGTNELVNNSSDQIVNAVKYFLNGQTPVGKIVNRKTIESMSEFTWAKQTKSKISQAWFDIYEKAEHK